MPQSGCLVDTLKAFVPHLRRRPNAAAPRAPRAPLHAVSAPRPPMPARLQVDSACLPGYTISRASLPTCICAPTARVLRDVACRRRALNGRRRPARPCVLSFPAFARALDSCSNRPCVRLLPALPCQGLSKNPWTLATGWSWGGIQLSRGRAAQRPPWVEARRLQLQALNPKP